MTHLFLGVGRNSVSLNIPKCGHHADLMFSTTYDTPDLQQARAVELEHIKTWVREHAEARRQE